MTTALLSMSTVAKQAGVGKSTVFRAIQAGELPAQRDGTGKVWVKPADAAAWIKDRHTMSTYPANTRA